MSRSVELAVASYRAKARSPNICVRCADLNVEGNKGAVPFCNLTGEKVFPHGGCSQFKPDTSVLQRELEEELASHQPEIEKALGLGYPKEHLDLLESLTTPESMQVWVTQNLKYDPDLRDKATYRGFSEIIEFGKADCFRGMMVLYTLMYFRCYNPQVLLLQAGDNEMGYDHNAVMCQRKDIRGEMRWCSTALSAWTTLDYLDPSSKIPRNLAGRYWRSYTSERPKYKDLPDLKGYGVIDLAKLFGERDLFRLIFSRPPRSRELVKFMYDNYTNGLICRDIYTGEPYLYPPEIPNTKRTSLRLPFRSR